MVVGFEQLHEGPGVVLVQVDIEAGGSTVVQASAHLQHFVLASFYHLEVLPLLLSQGKPSTEIVPKNSIIIYSFLM